jgi:galactose mutarotase-like enzyme
VTITLSDGAISLTVAPDRGAEVRSLRAGGAELLYRPPWAPAPLPTGPLGADAWERAWNGGWQLLWPNAGVPCTVDGAQHGFHGAGSVAPFTVTESDGRRALLRCELDGLSCERRYEVDGGRVRAEARIINGSERTIPLIVVEHLVLGGCLAAAGTTIGLNGGWLVEQTWDGTPLPPGGSWPWLGREDFSVLPDRTSRFAVVQHVPAGRARIAGAEGVALELSFDRAAYPHLWLWEERFAAVVAPWDGRGECLAIEPASVPSTDGLAAAIERGEATVLAPGDEQSSWIELRPGERRLE